VGFVGVLIILRPGFGELSPEMLLPIAAAAFMAISVLTVKTLSGTEQPATVVLYMNLLLTPMSLAPAIFVWRWPSGEILLLLALLGALAAASHILMTRAYACADASAILPFDYSRLPFIAVMAYFFFGQTTDVWTWVGAAVIAASSLYIARREARVAREGRAGGAASASPRGR
jgi:drug/metabolite transporter (DMT)-like permease